MSDYISKEEVLSLWHMKLSDKEIYRAIHDMPPAEVRENTHGEWIKISPNLYRCSECGRVVEKDWMEDIQIDYPFCHCGAIMDGGKTE